MATRAPARDDRDLAPLADGRTRRRERNRAAVVAAMLSLYDAGNLVPSVDEVAEQAGISSRSVFRYFDDVDDLLGAAIATQRARLAPLWDVDLVPDLPLADRAAAFVSGRVRLIEAMGNVGQVARMRAPVQPRIAAELARVRTAMQEQVADHFSADVAALDDDGAEVALATADIVTSWEAYAHLRAHPPRSRAAATRMMTAALVQALTPR